MSSEAWEVLEVWKVSESLAYPVTSSRLQPCAQAIRVSARAGLASVAARVGLASSKQRQRVRAEERKGTSPPIPSERGGPDRS